MPGLLIGTKNEDLLATNHHILLFKFVSGQNYLHRLDCIQF